MAEEVDDRFAQVVTDPRFRTLRKSDKRVKIDKRFDKMFTEKGFKLKYSVDKRGKPKHSVNTEDYKVFYNLSDSEKVSEKESDSESVVKDNEKPLKAIKRPNIPNARGIDSDNESELSSSSSESEDSDDDSEEIDHKWNEWDKDVPQTESATKRLAVCNIDWNRINANDLFVLINSFKPSFGSVLSVKIMPSELGLQRMKVESESGPDIGFIRRDKGEQLSDREKKRRKDSMAEEEDSNDLRTTEQLRQYEMTRLQYYYAVVECDSEATAEVLYSELDGMEYESSSTTLDIRFIPEDMTFDEEIEPKSVCTSLPDLSAYKAPQFINSALQQSRVKMTWDETDPKRKDVFERAFSKQEEEDDLKAYLASSDDEEDGTEDEGIGVGEDEEVALLPDSSNASEVKTKELNKIKKYKELLNSLNEPKDKDKNEDDVEMEISWEPNLKDVAEDLVSKRDNKDISEFERNYIKKKEKRKEKTREVSEESEAEEPNDKQISKKNNRKNKSKKTEKRMDEKTDPDLELLFMESSENAEKKHFNYKNIIESESNDKKRKLKPNDSFKFDAEDQRFNAVYTSHHYNVDPSDPHFKRTEAFDEIMSRTTKRIKPKEDNITDTNSSSRNSWTQLVRTVKNKTELINNRKQNKLQTKQNKFKN